MSIEELLHDNMFLAGHAASDCADIAFLRRVSEPVIVPRDCAEAQACPRYCNTALLPLPFLNLVCLSDLGTLDNPRSIC